MTFEWLDVQQSQPITKQQTGIPLVMAAGEITRQTLMGLTVIQQESSEKSSAHILVIYIFKSY